MVSACGVETALVLSKSENDLLYDCTDVEVQQALAFQAQESFAEQTGIEMTFSAVLSSKRFVCLPAY